MQPDLTFWGSGSTREGGEATFSSSWMMIKWLRLLA